MKINLQAKCTECREEIRKTIGERNQIKMKFCGVLGMRKISIDVRFWVFKETRTSFGNQGGFSER